MTHAIRLALATFVVAGCASTAEPSAERRAEPSAEKRTEGERADPLGSSVARMSEDDLKEFYLSCSRAAMRQHLASGEIALCSMGYERLLQGTFRGDFHALLAWRRGLLPAAEPLPSPF